MTIISYGYVGSMFIGLGVALGLVSIALFVVAGSGISLGSPEAVLDAQGTLHFPDTYRILFSLWHHLTLLLPLIAGLILIVSGVLVRGQIPNISMVIQEIQEGKQEREMATPKNPSD